MEFSISGTSTLTLTRHQVSAAVVSTAAVASIGYFFYRAFFNPPPPEAGPGQTLHRSNAVRRRRRSYHEALHDRRPSDASSSASLRDSPGDENADLNTIRPLTDGETVAEPETMMEEDWWNDPSNMPPHHQRAGQNIVNLLFRVSEDNARRNAYVHRGCACNVCGIVPIRGIRYRCANCADFDLCETCESQGLHTKTHIFYKVKVPGPPFGPRQMQPVWYPGDPTACLRNLPRTVMDKLSKETGFERPELEAFWEQWTFMANTEWREDPDDLGLAMDRKTFERCLIRSGGCGQTAPNLIHDRMFSFYDTNNDDLIGFTEFLHGLSYRKRRDKLRKIFDGYDVDKDGLVSRRDFLRVFRAYYVLYKQMHKDILEGLDDQVMSSTDAHELISSRQPISSLFGREGWLPRADSGRPVEGKIFYSNGDVEVADGKKGTVSEDKQDTADREAILSSLFSKDDTQDLLMSTPFQDDHQFSDTDSDSRYWRALLNPPTTIAELPSLLNGDVREGDELFLPNGEDIPIDSIEDRRDGEPGENPDVDNHGDNADRTNRVAEPGEAEAGNEGGRESGHMTNGLRRRTLSSDALVSRMPAEYRSQVQRQLSEARSRRAALDKRSKINARRKLLERWKRRQFYLDEEEGATAPEDWDEGEDVLAQMDGVGDSSKAAQPHPISPRSRSSSKVRFAEDTDDYEIRSNPSTSSRSVPERWGGMDIPDAERDAGREILYQVTQQAFNELLDILFKEREDLAVGAAETKARREEHRHLFESIDLEDLEYADEEAWIRSNTEEPEIKDQTIDELLQASGYSVDRQGDGANDTVVETVGDIMVHEEASGHGASRVNGFPSTARSGGSTEHRDPTMPQFRPNSASDLPSRPESTSPQGVHTPTSAHGTTGPSTTTPSNKGGPSKGKRPLSSKGKKAAESTKPAPIPRETLIQWKVLDEAEKEAKERGGWGLLTYEEFEETYKREEAQANRLDYLGSWIDFCIP